MGGVGRTTVGSMFGSGGLPVCFSEELPFLSSPFFKRLHVYCIYAVLRYEDGMNMCFSNY